MNQGNIRPRAELEESLEEQLRFIEKSAQLYDAGDYAEAKHQLLR